MGAGGLGVGRSRGKVRGLRLCGGSEGLGLAGGLRAQLLFWGEGFMWKDWERDRFLVVAGACLRQENGRVPHLYSHIPAQCGHCLFKEKQCYQIDIYFIFLQGGRES